MPYRFWLFAAISAFLLVTFVLYLPLRFQQMVFTSMMEGDTHAMEEGAMMSGNEHGANVYHEESDIKEGLAVNLSVLPAPVSVGTSTRLDFFVNEKPGNVPVPASDLELEHTKLMHVIGIRDDMNEFFHIHPELMPMQEYDPIMASTLSTPYVFKKPGRYKIWSEIKKDGVVHTFGHSPILVEGEGTRSQKQVFFARNVIADNYQVAFLFDEPAVKNQATDLAFDIHTLTGQEIEVEPYLGADIHLTLIKDDWKQFIHTHPEDHNMTMNQHGGLELFFNEARANGDEKETHSMPASGMMRAGPHGIQFHVNFPESGLYKAFAQFRPRGIDLSPDEALTASFWIKVEETAPPKRVSQATLVVISLALIVGLSWGVKRFLEPKV